MAEINTSVWGEQEDWIDASFYYESYEAPLKDRIQWASYDGEHDDIYGFIHGAETLEPNTPIDNSISYCGLGTESPLSHITYFRGQQGYSYRFRDNNVPWESAEANTQEEIIKDDRTRTNFALSYYSLDDGAQKNISKQYFDTNRHHDYFHQGWGPSSVIDTITDTTSVAFKNNPTLHTKIPVRLPIKNMVAIPYVKALAHVGVESPDPITLDLKTYLDTTAEHNYTTHPYMYQVYMVICSDPAGIRETNISRTVDPGFNQLMLLEDISMWKGMPSGTYDLHQYGDVIDYTNIDYSHIISYDGQSGIPILGNLIGSWNKRYSGCEPKGDDENADWDIHDLDWWSWDDYEGHGDAGSGGPECFAWAGPDPSIAWWEPNGQAYEKQANYKRFIYREITDADAFLEEVRKAVACFGLFFVDGAADRDVALDDDKMMLGILKNGIGHGDYSHGEANREQDQWNMDDAHDVDYDPGSAPPEPGDDPDGSQDPIPTVGLTWTLATAGGGVWALTESEVNQAMNDIFGAEVKPSMYGTNPMDAIISLEWTPFTWTTSVSAVSPIILGATVVNQIHQYPILNSINYAEKYESGQLKFNFKKHFYNSRCMQARLWLPFYGYYPLPMAQLLSSRLKVEFYYDVPDAVGSWHISFDGIPYDHVECATNIEIPLTGSNAAAIKQSTRNQVINIATNVAGLVGDAVLMYFGVKTIGGSNAASMGLNARTGKSDGSTIVRFDNQASGAGQINISDFNNKNYLAKVAQGTMVAQGATKGLNRGQAIANAVFNGSVERAALRTNLPYHGTVSSTTFLHLPMYPYVQIFKNTIFGNLDTDGRGVSVELGGNDEEQYMLKVGHACDIFTTIDKMPTDSLLQTTGLADNTVENMTQEEFLELNAIIQTGFFR